MTSDISITTDSTDRLQKLQRLKQLKDQRDNPRPAYNYVEPEEGQDESIFFEKTGETVSAPVGTARVYSEIENDNDFDSPTTTLEETAAVFEAQAGYLGYLAYATGGLADEDAAGFISGRMNGLANAQKNQPEYVKSMTTAMAGQTGFFGKTMAAVAHPRALGRSFVTNSPNFVLPLLTGFGGMKAGAATGAATAVIAGQLGPQIATPEELVTVPVGTVVGGIVGLSLGTGVGSAMVEFGAEMDQIASEMGYNTGNAQDLLEFFQNKEVMEQAKIRAAKKGFTTASVDAVFAMFGGKFIRLAQNSSKLKKGAAAVGDVSFQSVGEGVSEAAGQKVARGEIDLDEVILEGLTSLTGSVGTSATGAAIGATRKGSGSKGGKGDTVDEKGDTPLDTDIAEETTPTDSVLESAGIEQEAVTPEVTGLIEEIQAKNPEALQEVADSGAEGITELQSELTDKRIGILEAEAENIKARIDKADSSEGSKEIVKLNKELGKVNKQLDSLIVDNQKVGAGLSRIVSSIKNGVALAKKDVKAAQTAIINSIENAGLDPKDRAKFLRSVKNVTSSEQAVRNFPRLQKRVEKLLDSQTRRDTIAKIKKASKAASKSKVIAADFARNIQDLVSEIDTSNRTEKTSQKLKATQKFFEENPDQKPPSKVMKKLERLAKTPLEELTTEDLTSLLTDIQQMVQQGRTKQDLKVKAKKRKHAQRIEELAQSVKPIVGKELKKASIGERLGIMDEFKNKFATAANKARNVSLALNPMDVFFDMLDGGGDKKNYDGAAHTIFKKTIDKAFTKYLDLKENTTRDVKNLADKLKLDDRNFERIGVFAAAQQEGGKEKLEATGLTTAEIDAVKLTKPELEFYNLMRERLDAMFPAINKVMIDVYNKDVAQVSDYFPFMTDFDAMNELQIEDMVGQDLPTQDGKKKDVGKGFTESRKGGKNAIRLDAMAVFLQHVDNAAYLVEMGRDIKELGFLAQSDQFGDIAGDLGQQFTVDWIDLLARKGRAPNRVAALDTLRINTGAAILGYKLSTILVQPTALLDGAALLGGNYVARGSKDIATSKAWRKFLIDNMPEIRERVGDDPAYMEMGGTGIVANVRDAGFWALKNVDLLTASSVAAGAYSKAVESKGGTVDLNNVDHDAIQEAQLILRRTQSSAFAKDLPQIITTGKLTGNASLDKLIFQFQSFMLNRWSIIKHDAVIAGVGRGRTVQALNVMTYLLIAQAAELGVRRLSKEMIAALVSDDLEPWEDTITDEAIRSLFGNIPIAGSLASSAEFGSNPVPAISLIDNIAKKAHFAAVSKDPDKKIKHITGATLLGAGALFGVPGSLQAEQITRGLMTDKDKGGF